eukprot:PRCOL_00004060-RA
MLAGAGIDCAGAACGTGAAAAAAAAAAASSACVAPSAAYARGEQPAWSQRCGGERRAGLPFATRSAVLGTAGAAASSHPLVTTAALEALRAGGSAVDAAVAANAMQALVEPESNGLGGDLMALVWDPAADGGRGALQAYNGAGRSPGALDREQLLRVLDEQHNGTRAIPEKGALAVSVPGAPAGWCDVHARYGRLPLARLLAPAADAAARGFAVTQVIASQWREACALARADADVRREATAGGRYPHALAGMRQLYCSASDPNGPNSGAPAEGDVFANPSLARTLRVLGEEGCGALYNGTLASELLEYLGGVGSALGADDLAAHRGTWEEPVGVTYRDRHRVYELRPDTQGIAALQMLNMMELADVRSLGGHNSADYIHLSVEVKKLAFADRARYYADPAFAAVPVEALTSKAYAKRRFELVDMGRAATEVDAGDPGLQAETPRGADTVYIAVADDSGMMVSWIQSIYQSFGSLLVPPTLGYALQNRGTLFDVKDARHPNVYAPRKRPFHTIIPGFATEVVQANASAQERPMLAFGVMGGNMQPQGHVQVLMNMLDFDMNVQEAGDAARWMHSGSSQPTGTTMKDGGVVMLERGVCADVEAELARRGHAIERGPNTGGYQAILRTPEGVLHAASEMRKDGQAGALV